MVELAAASRGRVSDAIDPKSVSDTDNGPESYVKENLYGGNAAGRSSTYATNIMSDGRRVQTEYKTDGSEEHTYFNAEGEVTSVGYRSADYVKDYNKRLAGTSFETTQYMSSGAAQSGGGYYLTPNEMLLAVQNPGAALILKSNAGYAEAAQQQLFTKSNGQDDSADAFRHALFNAMNARDIGPGLAKLFGDAHERDLASALNLNPLRTQMDLFNNSEGYRINEMGGNSNGNLILNVFNHTVNGGLLMIENNQLVKTTYP